MPAAWPNGSNTIVLVRSDRESWRMEYGNFHAISTGQSRSLREVVLVSRLRPALQRLNPDLPVEATEGAVEELSRNFCVATLSPAEAKREIDKLPPKFRIERR
jgi:hypothetical protein